MNVNDNNNNLIEMNNINVNDNVEMNNINVNDDNNNVNNYLIDNVEMIIRLLEIGLILEYLKTIGIKQLLMSCRRLLNFRGIPPNILDRVMLESFTRVNKSQRTPSKLIRLPSTVSTSASASALDSSSLITVASGLSKTKAREVLITKMPEKPFTLNDLKAGHDIMKKVKCCFDISTVTIIKKSRKSAMSKGDNIVEISSESADRKFVLNHFAVKLDAINAPKTHTMRPNYCNGCKKITCGRCVSHFKCKTCQKRYCYNCLNTCGSCKDQFCNNCPELNLCIECLSPNCQTCYDLDEEACARCMWPSDCGPFSSGDEWDY